MAFEVVLIGAFAGAQWTAVPAALRDRADRGSSAACDWLVHQGWGVEGVWFAIASTTRRSRASARAAVRAPAAAPDAGDRGLDGMPYNDPGP